MRKETLNCEQRFIRGFGISWNGVQVLTLLLACLVCWVLPLSVLGVTNFELLFPHLKMPTSQGSYEGEMNKVCNYA